MQPGTDHASIATEIKIIEKLAKEGVDKHDIGREAFLKEGWAWKEIYHNRIISQLKKWALPATGTAPALLWTKACRRPCKTFLFGLYKKGMIYRGNRIINWCPKCHTSISDAEVVYKEQAGHFWHLRYPYADGSGYIEVATTRPETMLGDTGGSSASGRPRYQDKVGKMLNFAVSGARNSCY